MGTGVDELGTAGVGHTQLELSEVLHRKILSGEVVCCERTVSAGDEWYPVRERRTWAIIGRQCQRCWDRYGSLS